MSKATAHNLPSLKNSVKKAAAEKTTPKQRSTGKRKRNCSVPDTQYRKRVLESEVVLIEQSASPLLRMDKEPTTPSSPLTYDKFTKFMGETILPQFQDVRTKMDLITTQVSTNSAEITNLKKELEKVRSAPTHGFPHLDPETRKYNLSRRAIRAWPIEGSTEDQLWASTGDYIHEVLRVPRDEMKQELITEVRRLRTPGGSKIKHEALVIFADLEGRDLVTSYAKNLADRVTPDGQPTAGLRMDIPPHLMTTFKLLESYGRDLRVRYGKDFKRHVRFDDEARSLYLNMRIPGDQNWTRISPDTARSFINEKERSAVVRERLRPLPAGFETRGGQTSGPSQQSPANGSTTPGPSSQMYRRPRPMNEDTR